MRIVNYYKKLSPDDSHVPRVRDGLTVVLEKDDETPLLVCHYPFFLAIPLVAYL